MTIGAVVVELQDLLRKACSVISHEDFAVKEEAVSKAEELILGIEEKTEEVPDPQE